MSDANSEGQERILKQGRMQEGVVVFLDALGMKGILAREEPDDIIKPWEEVIASFRKSISRVQEAEDKEGAGHLDYHIAAFSDTIILTVACEDPTSSIPLIGEVVCDPFIFAFMRSIYLRGVIGLGKFYGSQILMVGPAIDEAAEWYTQPDWIGVSAAPSAWFGLNRLIEQRQDISKWFIKYNIPTKSGEQKDGWALAWPLKIPKESLEEGRHITARMLILDIFARKPVSIADAPKYRNTLAFFDSVCQNSSRE